MNSAPINVLLIEDSSGDARLIREMLAEAKEIPVRLENCCRLAEGLERLRTDQINVVLLDLDLPDSYGLDSFLKVHDQAPAMPIVVLTGLADDDLGAEAVRAGAQDYLHKGQVESHILARALLYAIERKHAEEQLKAEQALAQEYLDVAAVMLLVVDADQTVSLINRKGCELLGHKEKAIIGKNWFDNFLPPKFVAEAKSVFEKLMAGEVEPVEYYENPVLAKNGEERMIAWHNTVLHDDHGNIIGSLSSATDITERKQAEQALRES